ncbi:MAG: M48 family metalloprotease [Halothiobacillaceae bacterium]
MKNFFRWPFVGGLSCALALVLIVATQSAVASPYDNLPDMGEAIDREISLAEELAMGDGFMQALKRKATFVSHPLLNHYIQSLGERLAGATGWKAYPFRFTVIQDDTINAFAAPGGHISLFSGLILRTDNENELAGIMAHEMAHVTQRHVARMIAGQSSISLTALAALAGAILVGGSNPDVAAAAVNLGMAGAIQQQINFTRDHEYEADRIGIQILAGAGFDPQGMVSFFEKLARQEGDGFYAHNELLRTHPVTTNRIAEAAHRANAARPSKVFNPPDYAYAKATLAALLDPRPQDSAGRLAKEEKDRIARYQRALLLNRVGRPHEALPILLDVYRKAADNLWIGTLLAETHRQLNQDDQAIEVLRAQLDLFPGHPVLMMQLGQLWMAKDPERAYGLLRQALRDHPNHTGLLQSFADAALRAGHRSEHHEAMGLIFIQERRLPEARAELETARALSLGDAIARQRLDALIERVETEIIEARRHRDRHS